MSTYELLLALCGAAAILHAIFAHHQLWRACTRAPALDKRAALYPSVTVIRPIRGLDSGAAENLALALDYDYPEHVDTIFVFDDESEPAVPLVREAIAAREKRGHVDASILFCGAPPPGRTGKLNAMVAALAHARGDVVAFVDSDVRADHHALRGVVEALLRRPHAGAAFAPVVVGAPLQTVGDVAYALLLNALYGPAAALSAERLHGELPFIMGQFMVMRRDAIAAIGGLQSAEGQLVDDMYLGARLVDAGFRNAVAEHSVQIIQYGLTLRRFFGVYARWLAFARSGLPFVGVKSNAWARGVAFFTGVVVAVLGAVHAMWLPIVLGAGAALATALSLNRLHRAIGGPALPPRHMWVSFALLLASPLLALMTVLRRGIDWRGRHYELDRHARLSQHRSHVTRTGAR